MFNMFKSSDFYLYQRGTDSSLTRFGLCREEEPEYDLNYLRKAIAVGVRGSLIGVDMG
jgi:hypothetical protein